MSFHTIPAGTEKKVLLARTPATQYSYDTESRIPGLAEIPVHDNVKVAHHLTLCMGAGVRIRITRCTGTALVTLRLEVFPIENMEQKEVRSIFAPVQ